MSKNKLVHIEIVSKDPEKDAEFYGNVFDWKMDFMKEMNYHTFLDGAVGGGFTKPEDLAPSGMILYFETDDIPGSLAKAVENGGKVLREKTEIPTVGWYGFFTDLSGNLVGVFKGLP